MSNVPLRPKSGNFRLKKEEMDCITWFVLSGCTKTEAFVLFVHPELRTSPKIAKEYANEFFASPMVQSYMISYNNTLQGREDDIDTSNLDPNRTLERFRQRVLSTMNEASGLEEMESAAKLGDRLGMFDDEESKALPPQRYLAETCGRCRYRIFVEEQKKNGNIVDE